MLPAQQAIKFFVQIVAALFKVFFYGTFGGRLGHCLAVGYAHKHFALIAVYLTVHLGDGDYAADALRYKVFAGHDAAGNRFCVALAQLLVGYSVFDKSRYLGLNLAGEVLLG